MKIIAFIFTSIISLITLVYLVSILGGVNANQTDFQSGYIIGIILMIIIACSSLVKIGRFLLKK
jgi:hypothetical protein